MFCFKAHALILQLIIAIQLWIIYGIHTIKKTIKFNNVLNQNVNKTKRARSASFTKGRCLSHKTIEDNFQRNIALQLFRMVVTLFQHCNVALR